MEEVPVGCGRVSGSVVGDAPPDAQAQSEAATHPEATRMTARAGQKAPDFNAPAYDLGGFTNVELSDFLANG